jgi:hypothetical protein
MDLSKNVNIFQNFFIRLPNEIIDLIKKYIPEKCLVFTNKTNYFLYHPLIKVNIINYDSYVHNTVRRDDYFVFERIMIEDCLNWLKIKKYYYKNMIFNNYIQFIIYYCIENDSNKCRTLLDNYLKEHGLCKNLHKKNVVKYIKWKN